MNFYINFYALRYRWIFYINPNYYGFSASAHILLSDFNNDCNGGVDDILKCYVESGNYVLKSFNFDGVRPYMHVAVSNNTILAIINKAS